MSVAMKELGDLFVWRILQSGELQGQYFPNRQRDLSSEDNASFYQKDDVM